MIRKDLNQNDALESNSTPMLWNPMSTCATQKIMQIGKVSKVHTKNCKDMLQQSNKPNFDEHYPIQHMQPIQHF